MSSFDKNNPEETSAEYARGFASGRRACAEERGWGDDHSDQSTDGVEPHEFQSGDEWDGDADADWDGDDSDDGDFDSAEKEDADDYDDDELGDESDLDGDEESDLDDDSDDDE